jgi:hypothetical protein
LNPGSDNGSVNDEVNQTDPLAILLSQATQPSVTVPGGMVSVRLQSTNISSTIPQSDYAESRYINLPRGCEGILRAATASVE